MSDECKPSEMVRCFAGVGRSDAVLIALVEAFMRPSFELMRLSPLIASVCSDIGSISRLYATFPGLIAPVALTKRPPPQNIPLPEIKYRVSSIL